MTSKAEQFAVAAVIAPLLRAVPDRVTKRRVFVYSRESGEVLRETDMGEALRGLAEAYSIAHTLDDAEAHEAVKRGGAKRAVCLQCGLEFEYPKSTSMKPPACTKCRTAPCSGGCDKTAPRYAMTAPYIRSRKWKPWTCAKCAGRQRAENPALAEAARERAKDPVYLAKIRAAAQNPERREKLRRAATTPERLAKASENGRKGAAARREKDGGTNGDR